MATVKVTLKRAEDLGDLYERATRLHRGFADEHKFTMSRLVKQRMKPLTIERLLEGIEAVLSMHGLSDHEVSVLDSVRVELRAASAPPSKALTRRVARAVGAARTARDRLIDIGVPPSALPELSPDAAFVASAGRLVAAIRDHFVARCPGDRAASWAARTAQLANEACDALAVEEAASVVELACRWGADLMDEDEQTGTMTLSGPLVEPAATATATATGRLATAHIESAMMLDRLADHPSLVGALALGHAWLHRYPFALHVVVTQRLERVLGYVAVLPMSRDALAEVLRAAHARVSPERVATCDPGERVYVYLPSVAVRPDCHRISVKMQLRRSVMRGLRWLRQRGVAIEALVAEGHTKRGCRLLRHHGFELVADLRARLTDDSPLLAGGCRLHAMVRTSAPPVLGAVLHAAAFEPATWQPPLDDGRSGNLSGLGDVESTR